MEARAWKEGAGHAPPRGGAVRSLHCSVGTFPPFSPPSSFPFTPNKNNLAIMQRGILCPSNQDVPWERVAPPPFSAPHKLLTAAESGCSGGLEVTWAWGTRGVRSMAASSREPRWKPHMAVAGWARCSSHCGWAAAAQPVTTATAPPLSPLGTGPAALPKAQQRKTLQWQDFPKLLAT